MKNTQKFIPRNTVNTAARVHKLILDNNRVDILKSIPIDWIPREQRELHKLLLKEADKLSGPLTFDNLKHIRTSDQLERAIASTSQVEDLPEDMTEDAIKSLADNAASDFAFDYLQESLDMLNLESADNMCAMLEKLAMEIRHKFCTKADTVFDLRKDNILDCLKMEEDNRVVGLGICKGMDELDFHRGQLILLGGYRGTGKTMISLNIAKFQFLNNRVGMHFSIEMSKEEIMMRLLSSVTGIPHNKIVKRNINDPDDIYKLKKGLRTLYHIRNEDVFSNATTLEELMSSDLYISDDNRASIEIIEEPALSLGDISKAIKTAKEEYGDKLEVVVVDYLNKVDTKDPKDNKFDWKTQLTIAEQLKLLAQETDVCIVAPFQITKDGSERYSKALADSADISVNMSYDPEDKQLSVTSTKVRNVAPFSFKVKADWDVANIEYEQYFSVPWEDPTAKPAPKSAKNSDKPTGIQHVKALKSDISQDLI